MKLYLKQQIFSWGDQFWVYDANETALFYVEGEVFSWGKKLHLYDQRQIEVAYIEQKLFSFLPKYCVYQNGVPFAEVVKEFTFFQHRYTVNGPDWWVEGDFWDHDYQVTCGTQVVASVSKQWFTWGDTYEIDIADNVNPVAALAVVLVIDACIEAEQNRN